MKRVISTSLLLVMLTWTGVVFAQDKADLSGALDSLKDKVSFSGLIETNAFWTKGFDKKDTSDLTLATAQFGIDAKVTEWATGHMLFLYEEDATEPMDVDEGTITLGGTEAYPLSLTVGKLYVPFGSFSSNMISDPFTLSLGETNQSAAQLGITQDNLYASSYVFNCDVR